MSERLPRSYFQSAKVLTTPDGQTRHTCSISKLGVREFRQCGAISLRSIKIIAIIVVATMLVRQLPAQNPCEEGFVSIFDGKSLKGWIGGSAVYSVEDGVIVSHADQAGNMLTVKEYSDFILKFEFRLTPGANNGIGLRVSRKEHAATAGLEIQILDDTAKKYRQLKPYQFHGSVYGLVPAQRGALRPTGEWNTQEIRCIGSNVTVILNGKTIVDADVAQVAKAGPLDDREHPGATRKSGQIALLGHRSVVHFRNLCVKEIASSSPTTDNN